ncbi:hypothetical protein [Streptomyces filamentosus]|uniref:hypothetical protein n=1 Tax=Streptomyces filamentosus TaxID=67294 RepID=UPI00331D36E9
MPDRNATAQPGIAPTARPTEGTMFAALYGELVPHTWRDPAPEHDAYRLFPQRSLAMGRLDDRPGTGEGSASGGRTHVAPELWAMNDAGRGHPPLPLRRRT